MDFPSYREAFSAGQSDGLYGRPRRSTALAYTKGYDAGFTLYLKLRDSESTFEESDAYPAVHPRRACFACGGPVEECDCGGEGS